MAGFFSKMSESWGILALALPVAIGIAIPVGLVLRSIITSVLETRSQQKIKAEILKKRMAAAAQQTPQVQAPVSGAPASSFVRHEDVVQLTPEQLVRKAHAEQLIAQGRVVEGAHILEEITLHRPAISALETSGHIEEACQILVRIDRPNRAGVLCMRNSMFVRAADYFLIAGLMEDAAKAYLDAAKTDYRYFPLAADLFEKNLQPLEALKALAPVLQTDRIVDLAVRVSEYEFLTVYMRDPMNANDVLSKLDEGGFAKLVEYLPQTPQSAQTLVVWAMQKQSLFLIEKGFEKFAVDDWLCAKYCSLIPPPLLAKAMSVWETYTATLTPPPVQKLKMLVACLKKGRLFAGAAKILESMGDFLGAARCWVQAGDLNHCVTALNKAEQHELVAEISKIFKKCETDMNVPGQDKESVRKVLWAEIYKLLFEEKAPASHAPAMKQAS